MPKKYNTSKKYHTTHLKPLSAEIDLSVVVKVPESGEVYEEINTWKEIYRLKLNWAQGEVVDALARYTQDPQMTILEKALSIAKLYESPYPPKLIYLQTFREGYLYQFKKFYGRQIQLVATILTHTLNQRWTLVIDSLEKLINYYKKHNQNEQ